MRRQGRFFFPLGKSEKVFLIFYFKNNNKKKYFFSQKHTRCYREQGEHRAESIDYRVLQNKTSELRLRQTQTLRDNKTMELQHSFIPKKNKLKSPFIPSFAHTLYATSIIMYGFASGVTYYLLRSMGVTSMPCHDQ